MVLGMIVQALRSVGKWWTARGYLSDSDHAEPSEGTVFERNTIDTSLFCGSHDGDEFSWYMQHHSCGDGYPRMVHMDG